MSKRRCRTTPWIAVPALFAATVTGTASADANHDEALAHFAAGRALLNEPDGCSKAIPKFQRSVEFEANIGARLNLAECYAKDPKHVGDAWNQYKQAEQLSIQKSDPRKDEAHKAQQELADKVATIILVLPADAPDAVVQIDGVPVPKIDFVLLPTGYALDPSVPHTIDVSAPGRKHWTKADIKGTGGTAIQAMTVDLGPPAQTVTPTRDGSGQRTIGLVVGGVGIASLAIGSIFGIVAFGKKSSLTTYAADPAHASDPNSAANLDGQKSDAKGPATISTIGFIAGGVLLAGGAVLYFTAPNDPPSTSAAKRIYITPSIGKTDATFLLGGSF